MYGLGLWVLVVVFLEPHSWHGTFFIGLDVLHFQVSVTFGAVGHFSECEPLYVMFFGACC